MTDAAPAPALRLWLMIPLMLLMTLALGLNAGIGLPLGSLILEGQGHPRDLIGLNAAMFGIGTLLAAPVIGPLNQRLGTRGTIGLGLGLAAGMVLVQGWTQDLWLWFPIRLVLGIAGTLAWVSQESWYAGIIPPQHRGRLLALYAVTWLSGFALGPLLIEALGATTPLFEVPSLALYALAAGVLLLAMLPLALIPAPAARSAEAEAHAAQRKTPGLRLLAEMLRLAPVMLLTGFAGGFMEFLVTTIGPLHWVQRGKTPEDAAGLISWFGIGGVLLTILVGWITDYLGGMRRMLAMAAILTILLAVVIELLQEPAWALALAQLGLGGGIGAFYILGLIQLAQRFGDDVRLLEANIAYVSLYTLGTFTGPILGGMAMEASPLYAVPALLILTSLGFLLGLALTRGRASAPG